MENIVEEKTNLFDVYSIFPIEIQKALGSKLWDNKGIEYLDLYGGHAVISIGHSHPEYVSAITKQLKNIGFYSNSIQIKLQNQLAQKLGELSGYTDYNLFLCNSGAEANENAFKLASFYNGRKKIIAFKQGFHGRTSLAVAATDNPKIVAPINENENIIFLSLNDVDAFEKVFDEEICCVIIEGIQGVGGINIPNPEFLQHLEKRCNENNSILILDEVQSGYGRTGKFFAHQHANIKPHIITIAKGMGNGFPVAGLLINPEIEAKKEMLGTTFGGNYLACAAAISVLDVIEKEHLIENALVLGDYLKDALEDIPQIKEVRGLGLMIGIELRQPCAEIRNRLLFKNSIFTGASSNKNTLRILPSLAVSIDEIDQFIHALKDNLK
ncbi:acetylornithine aminotransferase [Flavobacterium swingsii]|uniref:Acetylornithine aminotransferase n=1 Tax=Flavobacterium swingsii TaxID=498292 RepID=A0A1I0X785_9FLAO|nr:aminotransferase class III-fold pyridoxal phosphate-dependent enzyme [Flavobacterium swingsii]SFA96875.1 acetylornithine aminotransferase [Flavobacterium swingsii]